MGIASGIAMIGLGLWSQVSFIVPELPVMRIAFREETTGMASLLSVLLGISSLLLRAHARKRTRELDYRPLTLGFSCILLTCISWYLLTLHGLNLISRQGHAMLHQATESIADSVDSSMTLMQRMAERWQALDELPPDQLLRQETSSYLRDFPNLNFIAVLGPELQPEHQKGRDAIDEAWFKQLIGQTESRQWLQDVQRGQSARMSRVYMDSRSRPIALIATPLSLAHDPSHVLVASLNIGATIQERLGANLDSFILQVFEGEKPIYRSAASAEKKLLTAWSKQSATLPNHENWRLVSAFDLSRSDPDIYYLPPLVLLFGIGCSIFIIISQSLVRLTAEHNERLRQSNLKLEKSLEHQARLQEQKQRIMDHSMDVLCSIDQHQRFIQISPSSLTVLGYTPDELIGQHHLDYVVAEDHARTLVELRAIMTGQTREPILNRYRRKDGRIVYLRWSMSWLETEQTLFAVAHDVTALMLHEAYVNDQRDILGMISADQPIADTFDSICLMSEAQLPGSLCSILQLDHERNCLRLGAAPSLPDSYNSAIDGLSIGPHKGACGTAAFRKETIISADITLDPLWDEYREVAIAHGLKACWSMPLLAHGGEILGTFAIYLRHPGEPDFQAQQLIETAAQLASIAIERQVDRRRLEESEQRYRSLFTFNPDPVFSFDCNGRLLSLNQAGCDLLGIEKREAYGKSFSELIDTDQVDHVREQFLGVLGGDARHFELSGRSSGKRRLELDVINLPIVVDEQIVGVFGIAKDIGERNQMTRTLEHTLKQSQRKADLLRGLSEAAVKIGAIFDQQELLKFMTERLRLLIGAHQCVVSITKVDDWDQAINAVSFSEKYAAWDNYNAPLSGKSIYTLVCTHNLPVVMSQAELEAHPTWQQFSDQQNHHPPMRGWLAAPLIDPSGNNLGLFQLSDKFEGDFDQDDLAIAQQFSQMAVAAIENNRLLRRILAGERRLQEQLDFTSAITNSVVEGLLAVDRDGRLNFVNPAAASILELSIPTLLGQPLIAHLPINLGFSADTSTERGEYHGELSLSNAKHIAYDCAPLLRFNTIEGWVVAFRDITLARESEQRMRLLKRSIEASHNGILICDAIGEDLPIIYANPAFERMTGYAAEEVLGRNCRFLQGQDRHQEGISEVRQALMEKRETHVVLRNFRKDGTPFWNDVYIAPVPNEQGEITHFIGVQSDISERKRFESELAYNASHDVLTGLPNRSLLEDRLRQGWQISRRYDRQLAVIFIDLDGFKPINDSMGHVVGDLMLIEVGSRLSQQVRAGDTVSRLGGDEFILVLPDLAHAEDVLNVADRVIESVSRPYNIEGHELHVTASLGIAISERELEQPLQLIQQADLAMYKAKNEGRNCYQWYTSDLEQKVNERVTLRNALQKAIDTNDFTLNYQPQIDGRTGKVTGYEALLRWKHPQLGNVSPAQFIPIAEQTGQIIPLSEWVLATACRTCRRLLDLGLSGTAVAVNISAVHFQRNNFVDSIRHILQEARLPAELLELEITETVLLADAERAIARLQELKILGVRLSIDDFGTGFSSLNYLKHLPIDKVKIDRAFVQEIISDHHDAAITQGIISMAHLLRIKVIAEGVETESQYAFLNKSRCDEYQGYYFARPMPFEQLEAFLREHQTRPAGYLKSLSAEKTKQTLLLLDDEENILRAMTRVLRRDGYQILTATRAQDAFGLLAKYEVQVILSDQRMPEMSGTEFLSRVKDLYPDTVRMVLSGYTDLKTVTDAINQGAIYKFLTKPWDDNQLRSTVSEAFFHNELVASKEPPQE
ncbi:diguanylate cyclase [Pseudomonas sp. TCU-HL1]|nr:diguanylate cyclase [Pseudomonas sp. TCU-HL1]